MNVSNSLIYLWYVDRWFSPGLARVDGWSGCEFHPLLHTHCRRTWLLEIFGVDSYIDHLTFSYLILSYLISSDCLSDPELATVAQSPLGRAHDH